MPVSLCDAGNVTQQIEGFSIFLEYYSWLVDLGPPGLPGLGERKRNLLVTIVMHKIL